METNEQTANNGQNKARAVGHFVADLVAVDRVGARQIHLRGFCHPSTTPAPRSATLRDGPTSRPAGYPEDLIQ